MKNHTRNNSPNTVASSAKNSENNTGFQRCLSPSASQTIIISSQSESPSIATWNSSSCSDLSPGKRLILSELDTILRTIPDDIHPYNTPGSKRKFSDSDLTEVTDLHASPKRSKNEQESVQPLLINTRSTISQVSSPFIPRATSSPSASIASSSGSLEYFKLTGYSSSGTESPTIPIATSSPSASIASSTGSLEYFKLTGYSSSGCELLKAREQRDESIQVQSWLRQIKESISSEAYQLLGHTQQDADELMRQVIIQARILFNKMNK